MQSIKQILKEVVERGGSDLHISIGSPPVMRLNGEMALLGSTPLTAEDTVLLLGDIIDEEQMEELEKTKNIDLAYEIPHAGVIQRFRCNFFFERTGLAGAFRVIPREIPTLEELNLPGNLADMARYRNGLVLVTGPTGSGKSTTLSALIDIINRTQYRHILTIEDPVEYVHKNRQSIIHQRQVGFHALTFNRALRTSVTQDADVIMIGELRDLETIDLAITAASTGHLVYTTMHTSSAPKAIERLVEFYPPQRQQSARTKLTDCLRAVIAQQLLPRAEGQGRIPAIEILINCIPISNLIKDHKTHQVVSIMQTSKNIGMISMDEYLMRLYETGKITAITAYEHAIDKKQLEPVLQSGGSKL